MQSLPLLLTSYTPNDTDLQWIQTQYQQIQQLEQASLVRIENKLAEMTERDIVRKHNRALYLLLAMKDLTEYQQIFGSPVSNHIPIL